jgi:transcriptional regulator with XRE-family HTH domain
MHWIEELRFQYGLRQEQLAVYLCVDRVTLSLAESDKRDLPAKAMLLLAPLLHNIPTPLTDIIAAQHVKVLAADETLAKKQAEQRLRKWQLQLERTKKRLAKMQQKQQQATSALQLASRIEQTTPIVEDTERHTAFINSLVVNALALLADNGVAAQAALLADIKMLETLIATA